MLPAVVDAGARGADFAGEAEGQVVDSVADFGREGGEGERHAGRRCWWSGGCRVLEV